jgi:hypothetical protein
MPRRLVPATAAVLLALPLGAAVAAGSDRISDGDAQRVGRAAVTAIETWYADHGSYEGATLDRLARLDPSLKDFAGLRLSRVGPAGYRITTHATTGRTFRATRHPSSGRLFFACTPAGAGACRSDGTWGPRR